MNLIRKTLIFVGLPFFFIISRLLIAAIFILYLIGHITRFIFKDIYAFKIPHFQVKLNKVKIKKLKKKFIRTFSYKKLFALFEVLKKGKKRGRPKKSKRSFKLLTIAFKFPKINIHLPYFRFKLPKPESTKYIHVFKSSVTFKNTILFIVMFVFATSALAYYFIFKDLPSPQELITRKQNVSTKIYDRNGILLYTIYKDQNRTPIELSKVPTYVRLATLAAEDAEFYSHPGISVRGIIRALGKDLKNINQESSNLQGGSTITQQLVKNALLTSERTIVRKLREAVLSMQVESHFSKDQILEMYLNEVGYGGTIYGIEQAARIYFGKSVDSLTLSEAALLAGLPKSPSTYSPFGAHPELAFSRQREILHLMKVNKFITAEEEDLATSQSITFAPDRSQILAPHFVMYAKEQLIERFGEELVQQGGLSVVTTLDYDIQKLAESVVTEEIKKLHPLRVGNAAAVVTDPKTGEILAMVGSHDYFDTANDGNVNVTTRLRQPGSSIKVVNYAYALENGLTLSSTVEDSPITFKVPGSQDYSPKNYDDRYRGRITLRSALAESRNIPAVKILASYGVDKMIDLGQRMGISTWSDKSRFGLSLTLGGGETKLIDLAEVYATIANQGIHNDLSSIKEVRNHKDRIIFSDKNKFENGWEQVLDPRVAYILIDVLKDNAARAPAFGFNSMLVVSNHPEVAVKTGTSNDLRDNLTVGFNQNYLVAVWVGNNDNSPMSRIASGITGAAPIWNKIIGGLLANSPATEWQTPDRLVKRECFSRMEWYLEERIQNCPKIIEPAASIVDNQSNN